jgi:preprotein translocase subunit SecB
MLATTSFFRSLFMSDQAEAPYLAPIQVNAQYIKDLSFEVPGAPALFMEMNAAAPDLQVRVDLNAQSLGGNIYEVALQLSAEAKVNEKIAFIVELTFAGIFTLNVPEEHLQPVLLIEAPRLLFPFARAIIADVTGSGGLPPLLLQPIDFAALFRAKMEQMGQAVGNA